MAFLAEIKPHGACDSVQGLGHVQTDFWTVATLPLIPTRSYLLSAQGRDIPMPLHTRSLAAAYLRAAVLVLGIATTAGGGFGLLLPAPTPQHTTVNIVTLVIGLAILGSAFLVPRMFSKASPNTETRLRALAAES